MVRTDLALETRERFEGENVEVRGVVVEKSEDRATGVRTTIVRIVTENGAKVMGRPKGVYVTLEVDELEAGMPVARNLAEALGRSLRKMMGKGKKEILMVGLGNREITPDSLGPLVIDHLQVNRHIVKEYGSTSIGSREGIVSAIAPGTMAQTGMETLEIVRGVVKETNPELVIVVDALAARSMKRLNRTIQLTDTGISPGSGVGNHRNAINEETLQVKVIGIGVPTVIDGATIVTDAMEHLVSALEEEDRKEFLEEMVPPGLRSMYVTTKDVDETVRCLGEVLARGLNLAVQRV